jgi:hypothetical protein
VICFKFSQVGGLGGERMEVRVLNSLGKRMGGFLSLGFWNGAAAWRYAVSRGRRNGAFCERNKFVAEAHRIRRIAADGVWEQLRCEALDLKAGTSESIAEPVCVVIPVLQRRLSGQGALLRI